MYSFMRLFSQGRPLIFRANFTKSVSTCLFLNDRSLVKVSGEDSVQFLQGLVTNDVRHLTENTETSVTLPCIYSLILTLKGRVLYDVLLYTAPGSNAKEIWVECDANVSEDLVTLLKKYRVRKKIDIGILKDMSVWVASSENKVKEKAVLMVNDPRLQKLGFRVILDHRSTTPASYSSAEYKCLRYGAGVGEGIDDHPPGSCFPLEINGDYLHGICFFKGCYIGQELTSRVHHIGVVRKRYMPVTLNEAPTTAIPTGSVIVNESGKHVGRYVSGFGTDAIALLRIEEALSATELNIKDQNILLSTQIPEWWPKKEAKLSN